MAAHATQTRHRRNLAEGLHARIVIVGEQPGNDEDSQGHPFVGPAGKVLDQAIEAAGLDRDQIYVTNAVKHFKWVTRGKRRSQSKPNSRELAACRPWLEAELEVIEPKVIVCLGATAVQAILGATFRITQARGKFLRSPYNSNTLATWHRSAILRAPDEAVRRQMRDEPVHDLKLVAAKLR